MPNVELVTKVQAYSEELDEVFSRVVRSQIGSAAKEGVHRIMEALKAQLIRNIRDDFVSTFTPSPVGYEPGQLERSIKYRVRTFDRKSGEIVRGYISIGAGLPYAMVQDLDGETIILPHNGRYLTFFLHSGTGGTVKERWKRVSVVRRKGKPFVDRAIQTVYTKLGELVV